jgi:GNAT superfamily N-acetyltransferase
LVLVVVIREVPFGGPEAQKLVAELMDDLSVRYGGTGDDTPVALSDFDPPDGRFFVAAEGEELLGCVGWRRHGTDAELKRMFTTPAARGRGVARRLLAAVESSAREAGLSRVVLETGDRQPEAIGLYVSAGYERIPDFGYYKGEEGVLSFARSL